MRRNKYKYGFIIFFIIIMIFAIYKIRSDEEAKIQNQQNQQIEEEQSRIKEINLGIAGYDTLNPIISNNKNVQDIQKLIYDPLITLSVDYKAEPCLATEWAKQNENTYLIKLRENVKWPDGTDFTSEDVRFTIDRLKNVNSIYSSNVANVTQVEAVDSHTIKLTLDKEIPFYEYNLIFPIVEATGYDDNGIPSGAGKYQATSNSDANIILEKNPNWWGANDTNLSLEKMTINKYATLGEMYNGFKIGNIDLISTDNSNLQEYIGKIGYNEKQLQGREHTFLALNTQNTFLQSVAVRKAIAYSIDKQNIVSSVYANKQFVSNFPLEYGSWIYQAQEGLGYDTEQSKQLLTEEGWTLRNNIYQKSVASNTTNTRNRRRTTTNTQQLQLNLLVKASDSAKIAIAENIKQQLANEGIVINIVQANDENYVNNLNARTYDIVLCTINTSPSPNMELFFGEGNMANYTNDQVTELMKEVKNTTDEDTLKNDYQKLSEIYKNEVPYISISTNKYSVAYSTSLMGEFSPNWFSSFYNVNTWGK